MKTLFSLLLLSFSFALSSFGQKNTDAVIGSLRSGNAAELAKFCDDNVLLTLPDKSDTYSRAQGEQVLRDFFSNNSVKGFELKHKGDSPGGQYFIGTLQTKVGNYRTHVFLQAKSGKDMVKEIRFQVL